MGFPKILVIDDEEAVHTTVKNSLGSSTGAEYIGAATFEHGKARTVEDLPDIVLLKAELPGADPRTLLSHFRTAAPKTRLPVVILSVTGANRPANSGTPYLAKPFDVQALAGQVQKVAEDGWFRSQFANLRELGGEEFITEMTDLFLGLGPEKVQGIRLGMEAGDWKGTAANAHSLKSSAGGVGAVAVAEFANQIEAHIARQEFEPVPTLVEQIVAALARAQAWVKAYRQSVR